MAQSNSFASCLVRICHRECEVVCTTLLCFAACKFYAFISFFFIVL